MKFKYFFSLLLLLSCSYLSFGQKKISISGKVVDSKNLPVEGAVIFIDKVKTNSVTDQQGYYKVKVSPEAKEILVFTLFYGSTEELINGRTTLDFILGGSSKKDGGETRAGDNKHVKTGSARSEKYKDPDGAGGINGQDPAFASYQTIYDMIRGRIPGVEVTGTNIKIMGSSSLNVSTQPLFVVDGVIVYNVDDISPQSVKSIEVLKGPDATVYGTRGSNGVIVITRISGKDTK